MVDRLNIYVEIILSTIRSVEVTKKNPNRQIKQRHNSTKSQ